MLIIVKNIKNPLIIRQLQKQILINTYSATAASETKPTATPKNEEFRVLNLRNVKGQTSNFRRQQRKLDVLPPRCEQMPVDQDWGSVWPGPRSFHPATVPLPIRQGYVVKGAPPDKYANAELMKIPNFLHLTPPVIKRQCEAIKKFCTPWPKQLDSDEKCDQHFPLTVVSSDYCHSSPTIRDPMSRIVTIKFKLSSLDLNARAKDKFRRLVGERYNEADDTVTIVTDRCPVRKQNLDYAMYLLTALYHESWNVEAWEKEKTEADMEVYIWENNASRKNVEKIFKQEAKDIPNIADYKGAISNLMNEGENSSTLNNYGSAVRQLLGINK